MIPYCNIAMPSGMNTGELTLLLESSDDLKNMAQGSRPSGLCFPPTFIQKNEVKTIQFEINKPHSLRRSSHIEGPSAFISRAKSHLESRFNGASAGASASNTNSFIDTHKDTPLKAEKI